MIFILFNVHTSLHILVSRVCFPSSPGGVLTPIRRRSYIGFSTSRLRGSRISPVDVLRIILFEGVGEVKRGPLSDVRGISG